jgi:hypothetical protein
MQLFSYTASNIGFNIMSQEQPSNPDQATKIVTPDNPALEGLAHTEASAGLDRALEGVPASQDVKAAAQAAEANAMTAEAIEKANHEVAARNAVAEAPETAPAAPAAEAPAAATPNFGPPSPKLNDPGFKAMGQQNPPVGELKPFPGDRKPEERVATTNEVVDAHLGSAPVPPNPAQPGPLSSPRHDGGRESILRSAVRSVTGLFRRRKH